MVKKARKDIYWATVEGGTLTLVNDGLPSQWRNILAMHHLREDELRDLSWAGHEGVRFLPVRWERPEYNAASHHLDGPHFRVQDDEVVAEFDVVPLPTRDLSSYRGIPFTILGEKEHAQSTGL